jgi:multiple sugar transport system ATP-binding protein
VRPEHLSVAGPDAPVQAEVIVVEPTGAETELLVQAGAAQFVVVMHGRTAVQPGERIGLAIEVGQVHLFDAKTQLVCRA